MLCLNGVLAVALHAPSRFVFGGGGGGGTFERSCCLTATKQLRVGGSHSTVMVRRAFVGKAWTW